MIQFKDCEAPVTKLWLGRVVWYDVGDEQRIGHVLGILNHDDFMYVRLQTDTLKIDGKFIEIAVHTSQITLGE